MPAEALRESVRGLMGRAKDDLTELVAFKSVADPKQFPPEECANAAQWVIDAFAEVGLQDVKMSPTPDGSMAVHGHVPAPDGTPTVLLYCHYDVQPPLGEDNWNTPVFELTERDGRWHGRGAADCKGNIVMHLTALRALKAVNGGFPCGIKLISEGSEEQGTGGLEEFVPGNVELLRADAILVCDTGNFAVGVPTLTTTLRGMTSVDIKLEALASAMHSGMFGGPAPDAVAGLLAMLASLRDAHGDTTIDGIENSQTWQGVDYSAEQFRDDANVLDGVDLIGSGSPADMLWARPAVTVLGHRRAARDRLGGGDPGLGRGAREPADPARDGRPGVPGRADRAPAGARAVESAVHDRARRGRRPVRRLARRSGLRGAQGRARGGLRPRDDHRGPGRLDPALQRVRRDVPRRRDLPDGRRGAEVPDPRAQRERRPVGDRAPGAGRGAVPRALRAGAAMTVQFTADDYRGRIAHAAQQAADIGLSGVLITPGPDLVYLTGYMPTAITERLTMLVAAPGS